MYNVYKGFFMHKQKEWASFRITALLYFIIILLSFNFYFVQTSFETMQNNTNIMHKTGWLEGTLAYSSEQNSKQTNQRIDKALQEISSWTEQNSDSEFYTGGQTLTKDISELSSCIKNHSVSCSKIAKNLDNIIGNIVYPKQNKLINMIYLSFALTIFLILYYLFNKKYFLAQLETSCARSVRYNYPLSMLSITIDIFEEGSDKYDKQTKIHILEMLGGLIISLTRTSDTASRYDKNHFLILLPDTEEENALILERRIRETLEKHDFMTGSELKFKFSTTHFNNKETPAECIARAESLLDNR
jgi:diguanylate cyclase (GGDEF)-like protein